MPTPFEHAGKSINTLNLDEPHEIAALLAAYELNLAGEIKSIIGSGVRVEYDDPFEGSHCGTEVRRHGKI